MTVLNNKERESIIALLKEGKPLPEIYKSKLFPSEDTEFVELTKVYQLVYQGKKRKEDIIAETLEAPLQEVRAFNAENPFPDGFRNMLIFGDNLMALKSLYEDQRGPDKYGTKNKIKLIYIDPPFSTKKDYMKDREKAYRDKIIGAQFIEFLRKRLILMREILADDGSIYVHLDWKKGHYIKSIMDEVFGEYNFINEIIWHYFGFKRSTSANFPRKHDSIFAYCKSGQRIWNPIFREYSKEYLSRWKIDEEGELYRDDVNPTAGGARTIYLKDLKGDLVESVWNDIPPVNPVAKERLNYPTQKPEELLARIIKACSNENDIVLDAFAGSGTALAVAEKLGRRWIGMDCGKLAIYTIQKRMLNLTTQVGSVKKDERKIFERVEGFEDHLKSAKAFFIVNEKARRGELSIDDAFLENLHALVSVTQKGGDFTLICPEEKFRIKTFEEDEDGRKIIIKDHITYVITFVEPKEKTDKEKPLVAKAFTLFNAGIYDNQAILNLNWQAYREFVLKLFEVREDRHTISGFSVDGYIGVDSAYIWDYPNCKNETLDEGYVESLHRVMGGKAGDRFYLIAPVISFAFLMDEIRFGDTKYIFLKVPISILARLIDNKSLGAFPQPCAETDVNEVIDAVGFDFISPPLVETQCLRLAPVKPDLLTQNRRDFVVRIKDFRSDTLASSPEDFENFETLSMVLIDFNFDGKVFDLDAVYWAEEIVNAELKRKGLTSTAKYAERVKDCNYLDIRIPEEKATDNMMIIFVDKYGNEKKQILKRKDFSKNA
ncbi:MAG: site-specific DNA-methyltransferase [Deltaproteobacteria bacterium]|nr:site-specific DNA-methyltransferase [Deltaproteobacteria bacterium]